MLFSTGYVYCTVHCTDDGPQYLAQKFTLKSEATTEIQFKSLQIPLFIETAFSLQLPNPLPATVTKQESEFLAVQEGRNTVKRKWPSAARIKC